MRSGVCQASSSTAAPAADRQSSTRRAITSRHPAETHRQSWGLFGSLILLSVFEHALLTQQFTERF